MVELGAFKVSICQEPRFSGSVHFRFDLVKISVPKRKLSNRAETTSNSAIDIGNAFKPLLNHVTQLIMLFDDFI